MSTGRSQAKRSARRQRALISEQKKTEELKLQEAESDIAERKFRAQTGGRASLIKQDLGKRFLNKTQKPAVTAKS